jgi:hypothetical protein
MKATMARTALIVITIVTVGCQKQEAQRPCPVVDPEVAVFDDMKSDLLKRYDSEKRDSMRQYYASTLVMLDNLEMAHREVWRNNLEHPDKPMGDVLETRKRLFGR